MCLANCRKATTATEVHDSKILHELQERSWPDRFLVQGAAQLGSVAALGGEVIVAQDGSLLGVYIPQKF